MFYTLSKRYVQAKHATIMLDVRLSYVNMLWNLGKVFIVDSNESYV